MNLTGDLKIDLKIIDLKIKILIKKSLIIYI